MLLRGLDIARKALRKPLGAVVVAASLTAPPAAFADAVTEWSAFADTLALGPPPVRARATAIMHVAMHDAVNAAEARYERYTQSPKAAPGAAPEAAARQAAARRSGRAAGSVGCRSR